MLRDRLFFKFLAHVASFAERNKMNAENLAIVFAPVLLRKKVLYCIISIVACECILRVDCIVLCIMVVPAWRCLLSVIR